MRVNPSKLPRPDVFKYSSAAKFIKDRAEFLKEKDTSFSVRAIAKKLGYSTGYFALILNQRRALTAKVLEEIIPELRLPEIEINHLRKLRGMESALKNVSGDQSAMLGTQRSKRYRKLNPKEYEVYRYLSHWVCVALREMANLPNAPSDIALLQKELIFSARKEEIRKSLDFLIQNGFIHKEGNNLRIMSDRLIDCRGDVYKMALARYHQVMLEKAIQAIDKAPRKDRVLEGLTIGLSHEQYERSKAILSEALDKITEISREPANRERIFHLGVLAYPVSRSKPKIA